jgi:catechol 2,3-dioxygenase-like lactoylglutathione lyase family enzyme
VPVCSIHHVDLVVSDVERSRTFYDPDGIKLEIVHVPEQ